ncbi:BglG family transcription antiterminator [Alicyclobacillus hesperidum]|uniref:BglG family transcription antiterminator n=1 Tax=Alicyclobacillus hesperidum TaxID=89784 RepID=UPI002492EF40|nr:BglG family transcription antiterminator [Alicyclobacillus hesperidum]
MASTLTDRQKHILYLILDSEQGMDVDGLARRLDVSRRTVHRDLQAIQSWVDTFGLHLETADGKIALTGAVAGMERMRAAVGELPTALAITPKSREVFVALDLLMEEGPMKLAYLGKQLRVTPASLSHQLNDVAAWLRDRGLHMIRRQGYGVEVTGDEERRREALAELVHAQISPIDLMKLMHADASKRMRHPFYPWLERWFAPQRLADVESVLQEELRVVSPPLDEAAFYSFLLHVLLACARIEQGGALSDQLGENVDESQDEVVCRAILRRVLPQLPPEPAEVHYLAKHLRGAKVRIAEDVRLLPMNLTAMDLAYQLTRELEAKLQISLSGDRELLAGVAQHLEPAIQRMTSGLGIRNPLLSEVKRQYPGFFEAVRGACGAVLGRYGIVAPDEEIGYLTMHLAAAYERQLAERVWHVRIVCPNGISSAQLLASRLKKEFPNVLVVGIESLHSLQETGCDFVVATTAIEGMDLPVVVVSPFLPPTDVKQIEQLISRLERETDGPRRTEASELDARHLHRALSVAERICSQILLREITGARLADVIERAAQDAVQVGHAVDAAGVKQAILQRERLGSIVLPGKKLAVLHARSNALTDCHIAVYRLKQAIAVKGVGVQKEQVDTVLVLLAKIDEELEVIELLGRLSAALVTDDDLVDALRTFDIDGLQREMLTSMYNHEE